MVCPVCLAIPLAFSGAVISNKHIKIYIFFLALTFISSLITYYWLYGRRRSGREEESIRKKNCKSCIS